MKKFKIIVLTLGILGNIIYLLTCLTPYVSPFHGYFFSFSGLLFPIGLYLMLGWCFISLLLFRRYSWIFFLSLFAGYKNIVSVFGFHQNSEFVQAKSQNQVRVLSWNVNNFLSQDISNSDKINQMLDFIKSTNADIICFQDFSSTYYPHANATTENIKKITGLPYSYFSEADPNNGVIIFSRWPFLKQTSIPYYNINSPEYIQWVEIQTPTKLLRVYNTHLSSMGIHVELTNNSNSNRLKFVKYDEAILMKRDKLSRIAYFDKMHTNQAELVKKSLDSSNIPFIYTADLNAVPSSYVYHHIRDGLKDAFLEKGWGFGRTYDSLSPTLRIDVLFTSPSIKTVQYYSPHLHLSDHYPIITDIQQ
jgi:endonuclease/exonuclease/phosphatase family metal-dependent hydrolase